MVTQSAESPPEVDFGSKAPGIVALVSEWADEWARMTPGEREEAKRKAAAAELRGSDATAKKETRNGSREGDYHHGTFEVDDGVRALLACGEGALCASAPLAVGGRGAA